MNELREYRNRDHYKDSLKANLATEDNDIVKKMEDIYSEIENYEAAAVCRDLLNERKQQK